MPNTDQNSVKSLPAMDEDDILRDDLISALRIEETAYYGGNAFSTIIADSLDSNDNEAGVISSFAATLFAVISGCAWFFLRKKKWVARHKAKITTQNVQNPWSRRAKTAFVAGQKIGELVGSILFIWLSLPVLNIARTVLIKMTGCLFGIIFGIAGMIGFGVGKNLDTEKIFRFGRDGWTKYAKTGFVYGSSLGTLVGSLLCVCVFTTFGTAAGIAIGSAVGSLLGFGLITLLVPLYHRYVVPAYHRYKVRKALANNEIPPPFPEPNNTYRTNFMRAGIVLGGFLGSIIGGIIGATVLPGIGIFIGAAIGNAIGSLAGGAIFAIGGPWLARKIEGKGRPVNSFDYAIRTGAMFGNNTGVGQAFVPVADDLDKTTMPAIGGLIFSGIAFIREVFHAKKLKGKDDRKAYPDYLLPWTQRAATGVMIGSVICGFIGFFAFPPLGFVIGAGIGGFLGGVLFCIAEPLGYKLGIIPLRKPKTNAAAEIPTTSPDQSSPPPPSNQPEHPAPANDNTPPATPYDIKDKTSQHYSGSITLFSLKTAMHASQTSLTQDPQATSQPIRQQC